MIFSRVLMPFKLAFRNVSSNRGRTILTLVGIVIGITSVIAISSSGQGVKSFIMGQVESFGSDYIKVEVQAPGSHVNTSGVQITTLKIDDAEAVKKLPNIEDVYAGTLGQSLVTYGNVNKKTILWGTSSQLPKIDPGTKIKEGSFYTEADDKSLSQVIVIGQEVKETLFGEDNAIGKDIKIKGQNYHVIGILEERGTVGFLNFDSIIYIPVRTLQKKIQGIDYITFFVATVKNGSLTEETVLDIENLLRERHNISDPTKDDFDVTSAKEALEMINKILNAINLLLLALTSISLIVGGVGIMNVMYVAVTERTFEIGLRKSVGARNKDILKQFLIEAVILTSMGGVIGIILGSLLSIALSYIFASLGYDVIFKVTLKSILIATSFAAGTGIIFGFYPAYKASRLNPMEALRRN